MDLCTRFFSRSGRTTHKNLQTLHAFERHLKFYVSRPVLLFEIGAGSGGSAQLWRDHLGSLSSIVTIDRNPSCLAAGDRQIDIRIGDQADTSFLNTVVQEFGNPDIVIDDGSHRTYDVFSSFAYLYKLLTRGGTYFVESSHTSYLPEYGGGLGVPGTLIEVAKGLIDELNAFHTSGMILPTEVTLHTVGIHFYDGLTVFERGSVSSRESVIVGG